MSESAVATKAGGWSALSRQAVLDRAEQAVIVIMFCSLVWRVFHSENPFAPVLLTEGAVVFFVLIRRRASTISVRLGDWLLAITATAAPLLILPGDASPEMLIVPGVLLVALGTLFQLWAKLTLRRSFGIAPANRGVKVSGPYTVMRHPMYAGYLTTHIGMFMLYPSLLNLTIYVIGWWAQVLRLLAEERLLSEDEAYREFRQKVRYRLIPGVF